MSTRIIRYRAKPERADENQKLIEGVFADLAEQHPAGVNYASFRLPDDSFIHVVRIEGDDASLTSLPAFQRFQDGIGERFAEPPVFVEGTVVGLHGFAVG